MHPKIALVTPCPIVGSMANKTANKMNIPLTVKQCTFEKSIKIAKELENDCFDVIISRGAMAALIRKNVKVPVVVSKTTPFDVLDSLIQAKKHSQRIALFIFEPIPEINRISSILGIELRQFPSYRDINDIEQKLSRAVQEGFHVMVGGLVAVDMANHSGFIGVPINSGVESMEESIQSAYEIALVQQKESKISKTLQAIIDSNIDGIIATDENNIIHVFNPAAEKITGVKAQNAFGQKVDLIIPNLRLNVLHGSSQLREVHTFDNTTVLMNRAPVILKDKLLGMVVSFQEQNNVQSREHKKNKAVSANGLAAKYTFDDIIGTSPSITKAKVQACKYAANNHTVLLIGETGTGKELFAHAMHNLSARKQGPFVAINCSALPESLLESELFGYAEGAFTGAKKGGKAGLFELADGGSIFLDEINSISLEMQTRLLRVIQEKEIMRLGSNELIPVDVRIVCATNQELSEVVAQNKFRKDLYYRINELQIRIPPLRNRPEDISTLVNFFLNKQLSIGQVDFPRDELLFKMRCYRWPGNVRELKSFVTRYFILFNDLSAETIFNDYMQEANWLEDVFVSDTPMLVDKESKNTDEMISIKVGSLEEMEKQIFTKLLIKYQYNQSVLAKALRISRSTLWKKLKPVQK